MAQPNAPQRVTSQNSLSEQEKIPLFFSSALKIK